MTDTVKISFKLNPITHFTVLLIMLLSSSLAAFSLSISGYKATGIISPRFTFKEVYRCESWHFHLGEYEFHLPKDSIVIPVYYKGVFHGIVIQKNKEELTVSEENRSHKITYGFLALSDNTFLRLKKDTLFLTLEDLSLKKRVLAYAGQKIKLPQLSGIGFTYMFLPPPESYYFYLENGIVQQDFPLPHAGENIGRYLLYFSLISCIVILTIQILTLDLHPSVKLLHLLANTPPTRQELFLALIIFPVVFLAEKFSGFRPFNSLIDPFSVILYLALALLLFILARKQVITTPTIIVTGWHLQRCLILALIVFFIITAFSAFQFPAGILPGFTYREIAFKFLLCFFYALAKESCWRGFLHTLLERLGGKWMGLVLTPLVFSALFSLNLLCQPRGISTSPNDLLQSFFFIPLTFFMLGYMYYRTRNIFCSTALHAMLLFLPGILIF